MRTIATIALRTPLRTPPLAIHACPRSRPIVAVGLQGFIQATRDSTAAAFSSVQSVAIPLLASSLIYLGVTAWREGAAYRETSRGASQSDFGLLALCLLIDLGGFSSFFIGDASDVLWAPLSAWLLYSLFDSPALALLNFIKEGLLFTDLIPVATISWLLVYAFPDSSWTRALGLRRPDDPRDDDFPPPPRDEFYY